jgi:hypothetical protein
MSETKSCNKKIMLLIVSMFILLILFYGGLNLRMKLLKQDEITAFSKMQKPIQVNEIKMKAIELSKSFAHSFFDGTAFTNRENQPVVENFKEFLRIQEENYLSQGESPLGGYVIKFGEELIIHEPNQKFISYAVWIVTTIKTRSDIQKDVIFITRVNYLDNELLIETAGAIPYEKAIVH